MTEPRFEKVTLDNGITLVAESYSHVRSVCIGAWIRAGSALETDSQAGLSHFIEHMAFKGTARRSSLEIATVLESLGGELNAFTDRETTCFHATVLKEHLELALDVLSDVVFYPAYPDSEVEREKKVILQELSMIQESPDDWIGDLFLEQVWPGGGLGRPVIGHAQSIRRVSKAAMLRFFERHYRPESILISVAGNIEFPMLREACERYFGRVPRGRGAVVAKRVKPRYRAFSKKVSLDSEQAHLMVGFEGVGLRETDRFNALILSFFLGGGMSSRLFQEIREKQGLAYTVECDCVAYRDAGLFTVYAGVTPKALEKCLAIIGRELIRLTETPLAERDLELVKGQLRGTILLSSDQMEVRQESLGRNEQLFGRYVPVKEVIAQIEAVTPDGIQRLARRLFRPEKESVLALGNLRGWPSRLRVLESGS